MAVVKTVQEDCHQHHLLMMNSFIPEDANPKRGKKSLSYHINAEIRSGQRWISD